MSELTGIISGNSKFKTKKDEGYGRRFLMFRSFLQDTQENVGPIQYVVFEGVERHSATYAAHVYGGFKATLTSWCEENKIPYSSIPVGTIKKHATGSGNASKEQMVSAAESKGHSPEDDNEADALCILYTFLSQNNIDISKIF